MTENKFELNLFRAISPLHVGSGSEIGVVDLPIQREGHTQFPKIDASSLKGAIRQASYKEEDKETWEKVFGNEPKDDNKSQAGAFSLTDARILFFPVQSLNGVFAYVTSPLVLKRFAQDITSYQCQGVDELAELAEAASEEAGKVSSEKILVSDKHLVLKEFVYEASYSDKVAGLANALAEINALGFYFADRVAVVSDDAFSQFVLYATDVSTRIRIDHETGTVQNGALFNEENLPAESILYSVFYYQKSKKAAPVNENFQTELDLTEEEIEHYIENNLPQVFQIGGNQTIGRGFIERHTIKEVE